MMSRKEFIEQMFLSDVWDIKPIEYAMRFSNISIAKHLLDMKEIQDRYKNNDSLIFRLCIHLFVKNANANLTEYVLSVLQIKEKIVPLLSYKCPKQPGFQGCAFTYHYFSIIGFTILNGSFGQLQRLIDVI